MRRARPRGVRGGRLSNLADVYLAQARDAACREHWAGPPEMVERIAALLGTRSEHVVVDVGCGLGGPARRLATRRGCEVVAIDVLEPVLALARARGAPARGRVRFLPGSAERMPVPAASVDQVWCLGAVAHFTDLARFASETARVLSAGGVVAVTELFWNGRAAPAFLATAPRPWRPLTARELGREFRLAGLGHVRILPWPGHGIPGALEVADPALAADLREGRLVPRLVVARAQTEAR